MHREELLAFYAAVIRTPADQIPPGSSVVQSYEETPEGGRKIRICDKVAAGAQIARMCDWNSAERVELSAHSLTSYLLELRRRPIGDHGQPTNRFTNGGHTKTPLLELENDANR